VYYHDFGRSLCRHIGDDLLCERHNTVDGDHDSRAYEAADVVVTTYAALANEQAAQGQGILFKFAWFRVVLDEGEHLSHDT